MNKLLKILLTKLLIYNKIVDYITGLLNKLIFKKTKEEYLSSLTKNKQKFCQHNNVSRLSKTKFYCSDCGKVLHFLSDEDIMLLELASILLIGSIFFLLFSRRKE